jgi:hypothetical protein
MTRTATSITATAEFVRGEITNPPIGSDQHVGIESR